MRAWRPHFSLEDFRNFSFTLNVLTFRKNWSEFKVAFIHFAGLSELISLKIWIISQSIRGTSIIYLTFSTLCLLLYLLEFQVFRYQTNLIKPVSLPFFQVFCLPFALCSRKFAYGHLSNLSLNYFNFSKQMSNFQKFLFILWLFLFYYILLFPRYHLLKPPPRMFLNILFYSLFTCSFQRHLFCLSLFCDTVCVLSYILWIFLIKEQGGFFLQGCYWFLLLYPPVLPLRQLAGREFCVRSYWLCQKAGFTLGWAKVGLQISRQGLHLKHMHSPHQLQLSPRLALWFVEKRGL